MTTPEGTGRPTAVWSSLEECIGRFECAWLNGERPAVEDYLPLDGERRLAAVVELVHADLECRLKAGEGARAEEYLRRFPELATDTVLACGLVESEWRQRRRRDPELVLDEFLKRFPQWADELRGRLQGTLSRETPVRPRTEPSSSIPAVPGYEVLEELGRGGMGVVYRARQASLGRVVALKMLRDGAFAGPEELARFRREAEALARLQHPNIVQVYEVGEAEGRPYFSLEYVAGGSLAQRVAGAPLPAAEAGRLVEELARAVDAAHRRGVVHRDLKPANVLLAADGAPKITDFGLAKRLDVAQGQTQTGAVVGTPNYMAPEQALGKGGAVGPLADVYALGAVLYELLTGRPPFLAAGLMETLWLVRWQEPVPPRRLQPQVPHDLETICLKCLQKEPVKRYASALDLGEDLRRFREGRPVVARPVGRGERLWRWCRRNPALATASGLALAALLAATGLLIGLVVYQADANRQLGQKQKDTEEAVEAQTVALGEKTRALDQAARDFKESRRQAALLAVDRGLLFCENGDTGRGLLWLERALEYAREAEDERLEQFLRISLAAWRRQVFPVRALLPPSAGMLLSNDQGLVSSMDGRLFATVGQDGTVRVWESGSGRPVGQMLRPAKAPTALAVSSDGSTVLTGGGPLDVEQRDEEVKLARLWDVATGQQRGEPLQHDGTVAAVALSPDGRLALTGGYDGKARLWNAATGKALGEPLSLAGVVRAVAFSPDGRTVLAAGGEYDKPGEAQLWDVATRRPLGAPLRHAKDIERALFSPDGKVVRTANNWYAQPREAGLWDAATGKPFGKPPTFGGTWAIATFSPQAPVVLAVGWDDSRKGEAQLWSTTTGQPLGKPFALPNSFEGAALSPDGKVACLWQGPTAVLWDVAQGQPMGRTLRHQLAIHDVVFSPDGTCLLTGSDDGAAQLWETATGLPLGEALEHQTAVEHVAISPDGGTLRTVSRGNGKLRLWDAARGQPRDVRLSLADAYTEDLHFAAGGRFVVVRSRNRARKSGYVGVFDTATGKPLGPVVERRNEEFGDSTNPIDRAAVSDDGRTLLLLVSGKAELWDVAAGKPRGESLPHGSEVRVVALSPDGKRAVTGGSDKMARLWDVASGKPVGEPLAQPESLSWVGFRPDGKAFLTADSHAARLWDAETAAPLGPVLPDVGSVTHVAFSPDGRKVLVAAGFQNQARLWDAVAGQPIGAVLVLESQINAVAFSPDGKTFVTCTGDFNKKAGEARLWDAASARPVGQPLLHEDRVEAVAYSPDSSLVATGCGDYTARLWDTATAKPLGPALPGTSPPAVALSNDGRTLLLASQWDGLLRSWPVPAPLEGDAERLRLWVQVISGLELDAGGGIGWLDTASWEERARRLQEKGGRPETGPTWQAPRIEGRKRLQELQPAPAGG